MAEPLVVTGGSLLDVKSEQQADLLIADGKIADIGDPGAFNGKGLESRCL